eukprot:COSAG02_NODE_381_length_23450_cov_65.782493_13_plen_69_part_00
MTSSSYFRLSSSSRLMARTVTAMMPSSVGQFSAQSCFSRQLHSSVFPLPLNDSSLHGVRVQASRQQVR